MSLVAKLYIAAILLMGAASIGLGFLHWGGAELLRFACYLVLAIPASCLKVRLPGVTGTMSVLFLFLLAGIAELDLAETLIIATTSVIVQSLWHARVRPRMVQILFSIANISIAVAASYLTYHFHFAADLGLKLPFRLMLAGSVFFLANTFPIAAVIALTEGKSLAHVWKDCYCWSFPYYLVGASIVGVFTFSDRLLDWQAWTMILPVVYVIYRSYTLYLDQLAAERGRADEARRHAEEAATLHRQAAEALSSANAANRKLDEVIIALRRSNEDLTRFAYVASHDLQEPIRNISTFLDLYTQRYGGKLGADADTYIGYAVQGAKRMHALVADLLTYSRAGTQALKLERVDLRQSVKTVLEVFEHRPEIGDARIIVEDLPELVCDKVKIEQVLQNLIGNALKFRSDRKPEITIGCTIEGGERVFFVRDNGIGFDPVYRDKIFVMFQRLYGFGEYSGSGIGLAICRRVVEAHGGRIWADSSPGEGSTFYFAFPANRAATSIAA